MTTIIIPASYRPPNIQKGSLFWQVLAPGPGALNKLGTGYLQIVAARAGA